MTETELHSSAASETRATAVKAEQRIDMQGDLSDAERIGRAVRAFVRDSWSDTALWLESCVHCGQCAEACHFFVQTKNPKYTPIRKLELMRRTYRREVGPFRWVHKALGHRFGVQDLMDWQDLIYDSCTVCGRCSMICPMGIDIASLVSLARHAWADAQMVPHELWEPTARAHAEGSPLGASPEVLRDRIEWLEDEHDIKIPMDREKADVLMTVSSIEIMKYPESIVALAKVFKHVGLNWTFRSDGYEATNFGLFSGQVGWQREFSLKLIHAAIHVGAKTLVLPECGHAYPALRWAGANFYGKPLPFEVLHITEFLSKLIKEGRLKLRPYPKSVTFHDPCQVTRRGGAVNEAREILRAMGAEVRDMEASGTLNWCCGGGGGVVAQHRADPLRYRAFKIKMEQVEETGADIFATSCSNCRLTLDDGQKHFHWDKTVHSLLEMVAENLEAGANPEPAQVS